MIKKKNKHDTVEEALSYEKSLATTDEARRVVNLAGEAVKLVKVDENMLKFITSQIINNYSTENDRGFVKGIINPFLGMFGLKVVSKEDGKGKEFVSNEASQVPIINADIEALKSIFHNISSEVDILVDESTKNQERAREMEAYLNTSVRDAENAKGRLSAVQSENARSEAELLKYIQRMLAEYTKDKPFDNEASIGQLLELLGITFSWDYESNPDDFQVYVISDNAKEGVRLPSLLKNNDAVVKGLVYAMK